MKNFTIGFKTEKECVSTEYESEIMLQEEIVPRRSVVEVYFPNIEKSYSYYNDSFDLKVGDIVFVEGALSGARGRVVSISYSFKIKLSDYKKVVAVVNASVSGEFYFAGSHFVTFDKNALPVSKTLSWFKAPCDDEEYAVGDDYSVKFPLSDLSQMNIQSHIAQRGHSYYAENRVVYLCVDDKNCHAVVEGTECYEVEFCLENGEVSNLKCDCPYGLSCKHEFAVMLQLKELLEYIEENYFDLYDGYFAAITKSVLLNSVSSGKSGGKITIEA